MENKPFIKHIVVEGEDFLYKEINSIDWLRDKAKVLLDELKLTCVQEFSHQFNPHGLTLLYVLSESHLAIHSWPEYGYIHIDLVTCVDRKEYNNFNVVLEKAFGKHKFNINDMKY